VESDRKGAEIKGKVVEKRKEEVMRKREGVKTRKSRKRIEELRGVVAA
jgi:hypothetical protein